MHYLPGASPAWQMDQLDNAVRRGLSPRPDCLVHTALSKQLTWEPAPLSYSYSPSA